MDIDEDKTLDEYYEDFMNWLRSIITWKKKEIKDNLEDSKEEEK